MDYQVTFKVFTNQEQIDAAQAGIDEFNLQYPDSDPLTLHFTDTISQIANDRADLDAILQNDFNITPDRIIEVVVLKDDSQELVRDSMLLELADKQPCCAHYDWTSDEVLAFARDAIAAHMAELKAKYGLSI